MIKRALKMRVVSGLLLTAVSLGVNAEDLSEPKENPFDNTPKSNTTANGIDEATVQQMIEQRMDLFLMENGGGMGMGVSIDGNIPTPGMEDMSVYISPKQVVNSATYIGVINGRHVYKDAEQGCYIYESISSDAEVSSVDESRCYYGLAERLRSDASEADTTDPNGSGSASNK